MEHLLGGGQAFDQPQPAVAVLEPKELLAVDGRPHVECAKRLLARGRVQDDEHAPYSLVESSSAHWSNRAEVDGKSRPGDVIGPQTVPGAAQ